MRHMETQLHGRDTRLEVLVLGKALVLLLHVGYEDGHEHEDQDEPRRLRRMRVEGTGHRHTQTVMTAYM